MAFLNKPPPSFLFSLSCFILSSFRVIATAGLMRQYNDFSVSRFLQYLLYWSPYTSILLTLLMDKQTILKMLKSISETNSVGPKTGHYELGARVTFALDHGLIE